MPGFIKRSEFVAAIEKGIANCSGLTQAEKIALRAVGATAQTTLHGCFGDAECGCPLTQVGLVYDAESVLGLKRYNIGRPEQYVYSFAQAFDKATLDHPDVKLVVVDD